jgi:hypothetical protein
MRTKAKLLSISTMLCVALFLPLWVAQADVETTQEPNGAKKTKILVNGLSAFVILFDDRPAPTGS